MLKDSPVVVLTLLLVAIVGSPQAQAAAPSQGAVAAPAAVAAGGVATRYRLGPGDALRITVFGEPDLTGQFGVSGDGRISFPLIGDVAASGKTVREVQDEITNSLANRYLRDPRVSAEVLTFRPYFIFGEVAKPGQFPYSDGISILNAIATAGGYTYRGDEKYVYLRHEGEATEHKMRVTPEMQVEPGETIRVGRRFF